MKDLYKDDDTLIHAMYMDKQEEILQHAKWSEEAKQRVRQARAAGRKVSEMFGNLYNQAGRFTNGVVKKVRRTVDDAFYTNKERRRDSEREVQAFIKRKFASDKLREIGYSEGRKGKLTSKKLNNQAKKLYSTTEGLIKAKSRINSAKQKDLVTNVKKSIGEFTKTGRVSSVGSRIKRDNKKTRSYEENEAVKGAQEAVRGWRNGLIEYNLEKAINAARGKKKRKRV